MPSDCGFSVKRSRRDVTFTAPYRGCHVTQQVRTKWRLSIVYKALDVNVLSLRDAPGWQLRATVAFIRDADGDVMPECYATALCHLLQKRDGAEDWWNDGR